jgi:hypothetical protein
MGTERKVLLISRHGVKKGNDIVPVSIAKLYAQNGGDLGDYCRSCGASPKEGFLRHSNQIRTLRTGKAILAGAFQIPIEASSEFLDTLTIPEIDVAEMKELCYPADLKFNEEAAKNKEAQYLSDWFAYPDATSYEGVEITPYRETAKQSQLGLESAMRHLMLHSDKGVFIPSRKFGVLVTHAGITEGLIAAAINSGRPSDNPVQKLEEIGGPVPMEGYAKIHVDHNPKSGLYEAKLLRDCQSYNIDIEKLVR